MSQPSTEHPTLVAAEAAPRLVGQIERVFLGKPEVIRLAITCFMARGHLLIEDVPGVGKTTLARALARSAGGLSADPVHFGSVAFGYSGGDGL